MTWSTTRNTSFYTRKNDIVDAHVRITVDWDLLARRLGQKASLNKNGKSKLAVGITVEILKSSKRGR